MNVLNINNTKIYPEAIERAILHIKQTNQDLSYLSGVNGDGPISLFENEFGRVVGGRYIVALSNCTSSMYVALLALGVGPGDEVILPAYTWAQTLTPVILTGATPVFADIESRSFSIDPNAVRNLISCKTKAIIGVHLYGIPADVKKLIDIAKKSSCPMIFDAAQGFGATIGGKGVGAYGDYIAFSFGLGKLITVGEGGALVCRNRALYNYAIGNSQHPLRMHKDIDDHRLRKCIDGIAMNFRMHPIVASMALGQIQGLEKSGRVTLMRSKYRKIVSLFEKLNLSEYLPDIPDDATPSCVAFPLIGDYKRDIPLIKKYLYKYKLEIFEAGLSEPLHLTNTIKYRRLLFSKKKNNHAIPFHETHIEGSCPNTEKRTQTAQMFVKV